jgi:hypothetical protein
MRYPGVFSISLDKYNPFYNLQTMMGKGKRAKLTTRGNMTDLNRSNDRPDQCQCAFDVHGSTFEIRVRGHLDTSWSDWLDGMEVELLENGEMILSGRIRDQAALMGLLNRLYGLNLTLLSVSEVDQKG